MFQHYRYDVQDCKKKNGKIAGLYWSKKEMDELDETLDPYNVVRFHGHEHKNRHYLWEGNKGDLDADPVFAVDQANHERNDDKASFLIVHADENSVDVLYAEVDVRNNVEERLTFTRSYRMVNDEHGRLEIVASDGEFGGTPRTWSDCPTNN